MSRKNESGLTGIASSNLYAQSRGELTIAPGPSPFDLLRQAELARLVRDLEACLTRRQRGILLLRYSHEASWPQIAAILEVSEKAALMRHRRILLRLRNEAARRSIRNLRQVL